MNKIHKLNLNLNLSTQYAIEVTPELELGRQQIRRWVKRTIMVASQYSVYPLNHVALTVRFIDSEEALDLNQNYRHKDYVPNVLAFEYGTDPDGVTTGDVIVCLPVLQKEAQEQGKIFKHHAAHLVVHGTLHTLGYDHLDDEQALEMENVEREVLRYFKIADPYATKI